MADILPFRALRYDLSKVKAGEVMTQPYDKITPAMQEKYYAASPYNLVRVILGKSQAGDNERENVYTRAAAFLRKWQAEGVLLPDAEPSFYVYVQKFKVPGDPSAAEVERRGFIGLGRVEDYDRKVVFRHEQTLSGPKADRLNLLQITQAHCEQIFMLYSDPADEIANLLKRDVPPTIELRDEYGVLHQVWKVSDPAAVAAVRNKMADKKLIIADGHHRYETALNYRNERRAQAGASAVPTASYERAMMTFVNTGSEGLTILATHRVVTNAHDFSWSAVRRYLEPWFSAEVFPFTNQSEQAQARDKLLARLKGTAAQRSIGAYPSTDGQRAFYLFRLRPGADLGQLLPSVPPLQRELDVVLLHDGILEPALGITLQSATKEMNLTYEREAAAAIAAVDASRAQVAFLLNPVDVEKVVQIATANEVMPQKSTDFYPKLLSGITTYRLDL
jgi:uncharacterized protein (DUF1015 family)